jgi:hypothetical protein
VQETTFLGSLTRVRLRVPELPAHEGLWADLPSERAAEFAPGQRVVAQWREAAPQVLPREAD